MFVGDVESGIYYNITNTPNDSETDPSFSPVRDEIAFAKVVSRVDIFRMPALIGGTPTQVTTKSNTSTTQNLYPSWSPNGNEVLFAGLSNAILAVRDVFRISTAPKAKAVKIAPPHEGHHWSTPFQRN